MNTSAAGVASESSVHTDSSHLSIPRKLSDTGLSQALVEDTIAKALLDMGTVDASDLGKRVALSSSVVTEILQLFKSDGRLEVKAALDGGAAIRFSLTDAGKVYAKDAYFRSGYSGPAPVSMEQYRQQLLKQSVKHNRITLNLLSSKFKDVVIDPVIMHQLGAAMHSGKAVFIYGPPGTGKTYTCNKLALLLGNPVMVPHAVSVGDSIVRVFDPLLHEPVSESGHSDEIMLDKIADPRYVLCRRPFITSGGELTAEMLEIQYDAASKQYQAPLQVKAANGIYLIDDLGRQRIPTAQLFNRWIVPMESGEDYLNMQSGDRMVVPFDLVLIFSTNLDPKDIADGAFLRRIGHKINFGFLDKDAYKAIWLGVCKQKGVRCPSDVLEYVIHEMHEKRNVPMVACHPRDLVGLATDFLDYQDVERVLNLEVLEQAWHSNFIQYS